MIYSPQTAKLDLNDRLRKYLLSIFPYPVNGTISDRRQDQRYPYPNLVYLTPLSEDSLRPEQESFIVRGKHISQGGLGFIHPQPLPQRRMIASLSLGNQDWLGVIIELTWCRFTQNGWYESGGKFIDLIESPLVK